MKKVAHVTDFDKYSSYKGGTTAVYGGYIWEFSPGHRLQNQWGWVAQHRLVAEDKMKRDLRPQEATHHLDGNPLNNDPDNLKVMNKSEHQRFHALINVEKMKIRLTRDEVQESLKFFGGIKPAARFFGCCHTTLRNKFPDLVAPYRRKSPTKIDNPAATTLVLDAAPNPQIGVREIVSQTGMSASTVKRIAERNGIPWTKKTRKGEKHRTYRGKPIQRT